MLKTHRAIIERLLGTPSKYCNAKWLNPLSKSAQSTNAGKSLLGMLYASYLVETKMSMRKVRNLISILMDSPLYLTLALEERHALVVKMTHNYPFLVETDISQTMAAYESIRNEGIQTL